MRVGDKVRVSVGCECEGLFSVGCVGVMSSDAHDGDWWVDFNNQGNPEGSFDPDDGVWAVHERFLQRVCDAPTGLTHAQLQARVAELEGALRAALQIGHDLNFKHSNDSSADFNGKTADVVVEAYSGLRELTREAGVWTA